LKHGNYATFMAKPMEDEPGSAMHIHQSVVDKKTKQNIFSDKDGKPTPLFYGFLGGQQQFLPKATCLLAPYVNSYRRLVPSGSAPVNVEWGYDNRTTGLRVPVSPPEARRVENRLPGADTNPYLVLAASLACGYLGMKRGLKPREAISGSAYSSTDRLPQGLLDAVAEFQDCTDLCEVLGNGFSALYRHIKIAEFDNFMRVISPWEREHLLLSV
jgi:glutamine synthetase